jgi:hypothetical protein
VDDPFEDVADGMEWFEAIAVSEAERTKIGRRNVPALLAL